MRAFSFTITLGDGMVFCLVVDAAQCTPFKPYHKKAESVSGDQALLPAHRKIFEHFHCVIRDAEKFIGSGVMVT